MRAARGTDRACVVLAARVAWCWRSRPPSLARRTRATLVAARDRASPQAWLSVGCTGRTGAARSAQLERAGSRTWVVEVLTDESQGTFGSSSRGADHRAGVRRCRRHGRLAEGRGRPAARAARSRCLGSVKARRRATSGGDAPIARGSPATCAPAESRRGDGREACGARSARCARGRSQRVAAVAGPGGDLLGGVLLGDRRRMAGTPAETDFRTTGLTHLVAVSGSHLVVVAAVAGWLLASAGLGRWPRSLGIAAVVGAYVVFSGVQPSAVRAWVMAVAASAAWVGGRRADGGVDARGGGRCRAGAVAGERVRPGIPALGRGGGRTGPVRATRRRRGSSRRCRGVLRGLAEPVSLTLAATAATLPDHRADVSDAVARLSRREHRRADRSSRWCCSPAWPGWRSRAIAPALGAVVLRFAGAIGALARRRSRAGSHRGRTRAIPLGFSAVGRLRAAVRRGRGRVGGVAAPDTRDGRGGLLGVLVAAHAAACGRAARRARDRRSRCSTSGRVTRFSSATGATRCSSTPDRRPRCCGPRSLAPVSARSTAVVITHLHADHAGGLSALEGLVTSGSSAFPAGSLPSEPEVAVDCRSLCGADGVRELVAGRRPLGRAISRCAVVSPAAPVEDASANESSVVLLAATDGFSAVLTGDAESDVLEPLVAQGALGDIDVLKVGHHGSAGCGERRRAGGAEARVRAHQRRGGQQVRSPQALDARRAGPRRVHGSCAPTSRATSRSRSARQATRFDRSRRSATRRGRARRRRIRTWRRAGGVCDTGSRTRRRTSTAHLDTSWSAMAKQLSEYKPVYLIVGEQDLLLDQAVDALKAQRRRGRRPGLQPGDVRGRVGERRRHRRRLQHAAVRLRAPPRDRARRRQDVQGRR